MWKPVVNYEGLYQVSDIGEIFSIRKNKIMKPNIDRGGYARVPLTKNGIKLYKSIHRLVAQAFIPNPNNYKQVNHKDCNRLNNIVDNLEWCTSSYNNKYAYKYGNNYKRCGKLNYKSVSILQLDMNGKIIKEWDSMNQCANELQLQESCISMCCNNIRKSTGGYMFKRKDDMEC